MSFLPSIEDKIRCQLCASYYCHIPNERQLINRNVLLSHISDHFSYHPLCEAQKNYRMEQLIGDEFGRCVSLHFTSQLELLSGARSDNGQDSLMKKTSSPSLPLHLTLNSPPSVSSCSLTNTLPSPPINPSNSMTFSTSSSSTIYEIPSNSNGGPPEKSTHRNAEMLEKNEEEITVASSAETKSESGPSYNDRNEDEAVQFYHNNVQATQMDDYHDQRHWEFEYNDSCGTEGGKGKKKRTQSVPKTPITRTKTTLPTKKILKCSTIERKGSAFSKEMVALNYKNNNFWAFGNRLERACKISAASKIAKNFATNRLSKSGGGRGWQLEAEPSVIGQPKHKMAMLRGRSETPKRNRKTVIEKSDRRETVQRKSDQTGKKDSRSRGVKAKRTSDMNGTPKGRNDLTMSVSDRRKSDQSDGRGEAAKDFSCICKGPAHSDRKFIVGCSRCKLWFHGKCVRISERESKRIPFWLCAKCKQKQTEEEKAAGNEPQDDIQPMYCECRTLFDEERYYVGCDGCGDWYHPECVGTTQAKVNALGDAPFLCPKCKKRPEKWFQKKLLVTAKMELVDESENN